MWFSIRLLVRPLSALAVVVILSAPRLAAQDQSGTASSAAPALALRQLEADDLKAWKSIRNATLSADGRWFTYVLAPNEGDAELVVRPTGDGAERRFPIGEAPTGAAAAGSVAISRDGRWLAFTVYPTAEEARRLRRDRRPAQNTVAVLDLASGERRDFERVRRFAFGGDRPRWIALQGYAPEAPSGGSGGQAAGRAEGTDLLLHELGSATVVNVGNVGDFAFEENGDWLAWTVDARDRFGNGLHLRNLRTDVVRVLDSDKALYRRLAWADSGVALSLLRGAIDSAGRDTTWVVLGFTGFTATGAPARHVFDPAAVAGFPEGFRVSPERTPSWVNDQSALLFGIVERPDPPATAVARPDVRPAAGTPGAMQRPATSTGDPDELPSLVLWHWKDPRLQSQQQIQENRDKSFSYLAAWRPRENRFVRLATDSLREVTVTGDRWAVGVNDLPYEREGNLEGVRYRDLWAVDLRTGDRRPIVRRLEYLSQVAPDGSRVLYYDDGHYHVYDMATGETRNVTRDVPTSFVNADSDHNRDRPPVGPLGWGRDASAVLLSDGWDIWQVPVRTGRAVNLTGNGRAEGIRYRGRINWEPGERGIDLSRPIYIGLYGERTKQEGLARLTPGRTGAERLLWADARLSVTRARDAEVWLYTRQTFVEFPDYWVAERGFGSPRRLTDANPGQREFAWSAGARLVNYLSERGDTLQAALFLPAGYEEGRSYPTVVYIYEKLSQNLHAYAVPNETRALNPSVYTSRGYAVLMPDIVYTVNDPGMSAVWCVVPAVEAAIATGVVDPARVGLHGHSWGGYQTAFLVTQTGLFRAAIAGAPLTDMVSMYSSVYWNTGGANQPIFVSSQGRFKGNFLDNYEAYRRNSPAMFANRVTTPLIILHNEKDGAVDFNQGITFYNTLRQLGKEVVLLQYVGENHGLSQARNQKDYAARMREFFDHHLRDEAAPDWLRDGVPRLAMEAHLRARQPAAPAPAERPVSNGGGERR
jgi:dipeptidyl aminopeptidase/acylaminoacyl peptidase